MHTKFWLTQLKIKAKDSTALYGMRVESRDYNHLNWLLCQKQ